MFCWCCCCCNSLLVTCFVLSTPPPTPPPPPHPTAPMCEWIGPPYKKEKKRGSWNCWRYSRKPPPLLTCVSVCVSSVCMRMCVCASDWTALLYLHIYTIYMYEIVNKRKLFELEIEQLGVTFHFGCYIVRYVSDFHLQLRITNLYICI